MVSYQFINLALLLFHGLMSVALLGAVTHQSVAVLRGGDRSASSGFIGRYAAVNGPAFVYAVPTMYVLTLLLGAVLYPEYRTESRYALEEMRLLPIVGLFELKEHWAALGLGLLPLYIHSWGRDGSRRSRVTATLTLGFIVWFTFIVGHVVNNTRGV